MEKLYTVSKIKIGPKLLLGSPDSALNGGNQGPSAPVLVENPLDRGAWWVMVHEVGIESDTTEQLNNKGRVVFIYISYIR